MSCTNIEMHLASWCDVMYELQKRCADMTLEIAWSVVMYTPGSMVCEGGMVVSGGHARGDEW